MKKKNRNPISSIRLSDLLSGQKIIPRSKFVRASSPNQQTRKDQSFFDFYQLIDTWHEIVGDFLYKNTSPLKIYNKSLIIVTKHPAFADRLCFMTDQILDQIFKRHPSLKAHLNHIRYQVSPSTLEQIHQRKNQQPKDNGNIQQSIEQYQKRQKLNTYSPKYRELKKKADQIFQYVEDEQLKSALIKIYLQCEA